MIFKVLRKGTRGFAISFLLIASFVATIAGEPDVSAMSDCDSLLYACQENDLDTVTSLLQTGADVNCVSKMGNTPLTIACAWGTCRLLRSCWIMVQMLISAI